MRRYRPFVIVLIWEVLEDASTIIFAVYNFSGNDCLYKVDLPKN